MRIEIDENDQILMGGMWKGGSYLTHFGRSFSVVIMMVYSGAFFPILKVVRKN